MKIYRKTPSGKTLISVPQDSVKLVQFTGTARTAGTVLTVPEYIVGANRLELFLDGIKCTKDDTYSEVGEAGSTSTTIVLNDAIPAAYYIQVFVS